MHDLLSRSYCLWLCTRACNLRCSYCYLDAGPKGSDELSTGEAESLISQLADFGIRFLDISGGEPLARKDIFHLIRYASDRGLIVCVSTNGTLFKAGTPKRLSGAGVDVVSISLDGPSPEIHNRFRSATFHEALEVIESSVGEGIQTYISTVVAKHNYHKLGELMDFALKLKVSGLYLVDLVLSGRAIAMSHLDMTPQQREFFLDYAHRKSEELKGELRIMVDSPLYGRFLDHPPSSWGPSYCLQVFWDGRVSLLSRGNLSYIMGSVRGSDIESMCTDALEDPETVRFLMYQDRLRGGCGECEYKRACGGDRVRARFYTGDLFGEDVGCALVRSHRQSELQPEALGLGDHTYL